MIVCINSILWYLLVGLSTLTTMFIATESFNNLNSEKKKGEALFLFYN